MSDEASSEKAYLAAKRELQVLVEFAQLLSNSCTGRECNDREASASLLFAKAAAHSVSLYRALPTGLRPAVSNTTEFWDLSSTAVLVRATIDTYYALAYIAEEDISTVEREFRQLLWTYHGQSQRLQLLDEIGSRNPQVEVLRREVQELRDTLAANAFLQGLPSKQTKSLLSGDTSRHLSHAEFNRRLGISHSYYLTVYPHLSNFVHSYPFALGQLHRFRAGDPSSLSLLKLLVQYATAYLARAIRGFPKALSFPVMPESPEVVEVAESWVHLIERWDTRES